MDSHERTPLSRARRLSKALALALRHKPWLFELELDEQVWLADTVPPQYIQAAHSDLKL